MTRMIGSSVKRGTKALPPGQNTGARTVSGEVGHDLNPKPMEPDYADKLAERRRKLKRQQAQAETRQHRANLGPSHKNAMQEIDDDYHRSTGKLAAAEAGAFTGLFLGSGEVGRRKLQNENRQLQGKAGVRKAWKDGVWHAETEADGAHRITDFTSRDEGKSRVKPVELKGPSNSRWARLGRFAETGRGQAAIIGGSVLAPAAIATARLHGPAKENERIKASVAAERARNRAEARKVKTRIEKKDNRKSGQGQSGAIMQGAGTTLAGTGLIAGGIPGAPEPSKTKMFPLSVRGKGLLGKKPDGTTHGEGGLLSRKNLKNNLKEAPKLGRSGILGFRAAAHENFNDGFKTNLPLKGAGKPDNIPNSPSESSNYLRGHLKGKIVEEDKVIRGLRRGRKASYALTIGGGGLAIAGARKNRQEVGKLYTEHRVTGDKVEYRDDDGNRWHGALKDHHRQPGTSKQVKRFTNGRTIYGKADDRRGGNTAGTALGAGASLAAVGDLAPRGLRRIGRSYERKAISNVEEAQRLAPHFGGVKEVPGSIDAAWGKVIRKPKKMMEPVRHDKELRHDADRIHGGKNSGRAMRAGYLRGQAGQQKHFAEVFDSTARAFGRARTPGLVLAAAGAGGLAQQNSKPAMAPPAAGRGRKVKTAKADVSKARTYGYMEERRNKRRTTQAGVGTAAVVAGAAHTQRGRQYAPQASEAVRRETGRGIGALRRIPGMGTAFDIVPRHMRAPLSITGGALLAARSLPLKDERFVPTGRF